MQKKPFPVALAFGMMVALGMSGCDQRLSQSSSRTEQPNPQTKAVDGLTFYYGVVKGVTVQEHSAAHTEAIMHTGPPASPNAYHIVLALFATNSNQRITDATVEVRLGRSSGLTNAWQPMEAMLDAGTVSFGRYVELPDSGRYLVEFRVSGVGKTRPTTARFAYERPE